MRKLKKRGVPNWKNFRKRGVPNRKGKENDIRTDEVEFPHEAKIGKISDKEIFYLMSRGLSEEDAKAMIVRGFAYPISKELPVEYAVEMNNLINLELEGSIG